MRLYVLVMVLGVALGAWGWDLLCGGPGGNRHPLAVGPLAPQSTTTSVARQSVKSHVTTTTTKPDGSKTVVVADVTTKEKDQSTAKVEVVSPSTPRSKWSVGASVDPFDVHNYRLEIGRRLGDSPFWGIGEYEPKDKTARVGVRVEW